MEAGTGGGRTSSGGGGLRGRPGRRARARRSAAEARRGRATTTAADSRGAVEGWMTHQSKALSRRARASKSSPSPGTADSCLRAAPRRARTSSGSARPRPRKSQQPLTAILDRWLPGRLSQQCRRSAPASTRPPRSRAGPRTSPRRPRSGVPLACHRGTPASARASERRANWASPPGLKHRHRPSTREGSPPWAATSPRAAAALPRLHGPRQRPPAPRATEAQVAYPAAPRGRPRRALRLGKAPWAGSGPPPWPPAVVSPTAAAAPP
mmetsp:Transcript_98603/g.267728  ORF Transcript_98603/g.267728 Transcript_98603/m.267728 type:complete len:267 (+) Transcript_98603:21-821(+)